MPPLLLLIDAGNSRIKWGLADTRTQRLLQTSSQPPSDLTQLPWSLSRTVHISSVRDAAFNQALEQTARHHGLSRICWLHSQPAWQKLHNGYAQPATLGRDRWAVLIAAHHLYPEQNCLLIDAGTAITADLLRADGQHLGGWILPGWQLMENGLSHATTLAHCRLKPQHPAPAGRTTQNGISAGLSALLTGGLEHIYQQASQHPNLYCLTTGGDADHLATCLPDRAHPIHHPHLVLEGLLANAQG